MNSNIIKDRVYPKIVINTTKTKNTFGAYTGYRTDIFTYLRIKDTNGKYYLSHFFRSFIGELDASKINKFLVDVYDFQLLGKVNTNVEDTFGNKVFILDDNQDSEERRILTSRL